MKKKLAWFLLIWLLVPALAFPASAAQIIFETDSIPAERQKERLTETATAEHSGATASGAPCDDGRAGK